MKKVIIISIIASALMLSSCASFKKMPAKKIAYKEMYSEKPLSILIMPPINRTTSVDAKEYFHATLLHPLAELGYYVVPPFLSMEILKKESAYDADLFLGQSLKMFGETFGADMVLFTVIHKWDKRVVSATVTVQIEYIIKSTATNKVLYQRKGTVVYSTATKSSGGLGGALAAMAVSAVKTATADYMPLAIKCNAYTLSDVPRGNYSPLHGLDGEGASGRNNFTYKYGGR